MKGSAAVLAVVVGLLVVGFRAQDQPWDQHPWSDTHKSPLTAYVHRQASSIENQYQDWKVSETFLTFEGYTVYNIYLTSGTWLTSTESNTFVQTHWLQFCLPNKIVDPTTAYLWIDGGSVKAFDNPPDQLDRTVWVPCVESNTLSFGLFQVPNSPVYFNGDPNYSRRSEDAIIAWTWAHYVNNTAEPDWLARMPMTRAGIKAMDAAQQYWDTVRGNLAGIERFIVGGASKRGWTAWTVGCMGDPRVAAIVPVVAPIPNIQPQMNEQYESYGDWSFAIKDYVDLGLMGWLNLPEFQKMLEIIDPLYYPEQMAKIPKYQIGATGDEFFMPDALKWYWDGLKGEKLYRMIPNAEHSIAGHINETLKSLTGYLMSFKQGTEMEKPVVEWEISEDALTIVVTATTKGLVKVKVWKSLNKGDRDWRTIKCVDKKPSCTNPLSFFVPSSDFTEEGTGVYKASIEKPDDGHWSAFFIELSYQFYEGVDDVVFTTDVAIAPRTMPYAPCPDNMCKCGWACGVTPP